MPAAVINIILILHTGVSNVLMFYRVVNTIFLSFKKFCLEARERNILWFFWRWLPSGQWDLLPHVLLGSWTLCLPVGFTFTSFWKSKKCLVGVRESLGLETKPTFTIHRCEQESVVWLRVYLEPAQTSRLQLLSDRLIYAPAACFLLLLLSLLLPLCRCPAVCLIFLKATAINQSLFI